MWQAIALCPQRLNRCTTERGHQLTPAQLERLKCLQEQLVTVLKFTVKTNQRQTLWNIAFMYVPVAFWTLAYTPIATINKEKTWGRKREIVNAQKHLNQSTKSRSLFSHLSWFLSSWWASHLAQNYYNHLLWWWKTRQGHGWGFGKIKHIC